MTVNSHKLREIISGLNSPQEEVRSTALETVGAAIRQGSISRVVTDEVNNHVHTTYSFSPYEPSMAAFQAWEAGLQIVGSMDHDSISAAEEMLEAGYHLGIATTVGFEVRCGFHDTPLADRKINNPDSKGIVYMCVHGASADRIEECRQFLKPVNIERNKRNRAEVDALNERIAEYGIPLIDFDRDAAPLSRWNEDGSITERHILAALADKIIGISGAGEPVVTLLEKQLGLTISGRLRTYLMDSGNPHYRYDLLGALKGGFLPEFFIQPSRAETIPARDVVNFAKSIGAIPAYAYLGDVSDSPTGDKKAEQFEDSYLDELFEVLVDIGYTAVTYMPPRNSIEQLMRVRKLAEKHGLMEISGVDINSSRQSFSCPELLQPEFSHLQDSAWALVAHEKLSALDTTLGLFHPENPLAAKALSERIAAYARVGRNSDPFNRDMEASAKALLQGV